jgi:hypothetical protein
MPWMSVSTNTKRERNMDQPWNADELSARPFWRRSVGWMLAGAAILVLAGFSMGWTSARMTDPPPAEKVVGMPPPGEVQVMSITAPPLPVAPAGHTDE